MTLRDFFKAHPRAALGFSGGADSSYLLWAGRRYGAEVRPYFVDTAFQPRFEREDAERVAALCNTALTVLQPDILSCPEVARNEAGRCYHCKRVIFGEIAKAAREDGFALLIDGTNASDDETDRPGTRALRELSVISPLRECGLRKNEIRELSREAGLFTWDKPAYACLATRIPAGTPVDIETLQRAEQAENELFLLGFRDFRVRILNGCARIQVKKEDWARLCGMRDELKSRLKGFRGVLLDTETR